MRVRVSAESQLIDFHETDKDVFLILEGSAQAVATSEGATE